MSTGRDVSRARELISIARDWLCLLRSESFTEFSITMYVSNTKSILAELISLLFLDKYYFDRFGHQLVFLKRYDGEIKSNFGSFSIS